MTKLEQALGNLIWEVERGDKWWDVRKKETNSGYVPIFFYSLCSLDPL